MLDFFIWSKELFLENKRQVLFIEWSTKGRDFEIDLPLIYFFEQVLNWKVNYISIFNLPKILSTHPDIVIMSNTTGASVNYNIAKIIKKSNILFFSHVSEGFFKEIVLDGCLWGWNTQKKFNENLSMLWSIKSYDMSLKYYSYLDKQLKISGSLGHDKYHIYQYTTLKKDKYTKKIGYAAFNFEYDIENREKQINQYGLDWYESHIHYIKMINKILTHIVEKNQDILFILKNHPGSSGNLSLELQGLEKFENVRIINNEYSIVDVIASSDIWLNYRSSTNLEAWLLDKPSISFCIESCLLAHTEICYGSILEKNPEKIQNYIDEFYQTRKIEAFEKKKSIREKLIKEMIGFDDGLNHLRFMSFLKPYIEKVERNEIKRGKWNISLKRRLKGYVQYIVYRVSKGRYKTPFIKKWAHIYDMFDEKEIEKEKRIRYPDFDKFYENNQNKIEDIYEKYSLHWKKELNIK